MGLLDLVASLSFRDGFSQPFDKLYKAQQQAGAGFDRLDHASRQAENALERSSGVASTVGSAFRGLNTVAGALGLSLGGLSLAMGARLAIDLGNLGIQAQTTERAFNNVMESVGANVGLLDDLRAAAGGTVGDVELMTQANVALAGASGELGREMAAALPRLLEAARAASTLNPVMGDTAFMYQSLITGIKRGSPLLIDNTGIVMKEGEAYDNFARSIGKSADELTSTERSLAILKATLAGSDRLIAQAGDAMNDASVSASRLKTAWQELKTTIGEGLAAPVGGLQNSLADTMNQVNSIISSDAIDRQMAMIKGLEQELADLNAMPINPGGVLGGADSARAFVSIEEKRQAIAALREQIDRLSVAAGRQMQAENAGALATANAARLVREYADSTIGATSGTQQMDSATRQAVGGMVALAQAAGKTGDVLQWVRNVMQATQSVSAGKTFLGGVDVLSQQQYINLTNSRVALEKGLAAQVAARVTTQQKADYQLAAFDNRIQNYVTTQRNAQRVTVESTKATKDYSTALSSVADTAQDATQAAQAAFDKLSGVIGTQLRSSFTLDSLAPELIADETRVDEHYRRLAAIAVRGQSEIEQHQADWADTIAQIPESVRAAGVGAMQAWARDKVQAYSRGLDYALIDKETIKAQTRQQMQAEMLREQVIQEIAAEMNNVPLDTIRQATGGTALGAPMATGVLTGYKDSLNGDMMVQATTQALNDATTTQAPLLQAVGGGIGKQVIGGILAAMRTGAPDIINTLAEAIAPSVVKQMQMQARRVGA